MAVPFPVPEESAPVDPLPLRQPAPRGIGLRRRFFLVLFLAGGVLLCVMLVLVNRRVTAPVQQRKAEAAPQLGYVPDVMRGLPDSYSKLAQMAPKEPPPSPDKPGPTEKPAPAARQTPAGKPELSDREKAALAARKGGLDVNQPKEAQGKGGQPVALPASPLPSGAPPEAAQRTDKDAWRQQQARLQETEVSDRLHTPSSLYMLLAGTWIPASLESGINSQLPGHIKGRVRQHVYDTVTGQYLLIPQNTVLIGEYDSKVVYGEDRVMVIWTRLILPNGTSIQLEGMDGVDMAGYTGLKDTVDNHYWKLLGAVLMSSVLSMGARVPYGTPSTGDYYQSLPQQFAQEFGQAANQAGQQIVRRQLSVPPTIKIRPGMSINVFTHKDVVLQPYQWGVATAPGRR